MYKILLFLTTSMLTMIYMHSTFPRENMGDLDLVFKIYSIGISMGFLLTITVVMIAMALALLEVKIPFVSTTTESTWTYLIVLSITALILFVGQPESFTTGISDYFFALAAPFYSVFEVLMSKINVNE